LPGRCQALIALGKAETPVAVTHLALARSQNIGGVILGIRKKRAADEAAFYVQIRQIALRKAVWSLRRVYQTA